MQHGGEAATGRVAQAADAIGRRRAASATSPLSGAVSDSSSTSRSSSPRAIMIAMPWSPIGPETITRSPARIAAGPSVERVLDRPDARRVDVEAIRLAALDDLGVAGDDLDARGLRRRAIEATMRSRSATGRPSSTMNPADRASGRAPAIARSLTVPFTASSPMSPPGKKSGRTTKESVVNASAALAVVEQGAVGERLQQRVAEVRRRKSASIRSWLDLPPAPWESVICSSRILRRGRRRRSSIASRTSSSSGRSAGAVALHQRRAPSRAGAGRRDGRSCSRRRRRPREETMQVPIGCLRRAGGAEHLALPRLDHALEHLAALAGLRVGDPHAGHLEADLGVEVGELRRAASGRSAR